MKIYWKVRSVRGVLLGLIVNCNMICDSQIFKDVKRFMVATLSSTWVNFGTDISVSNAVKWGYLAG